MGERCVEPPDSTGPEKLLWLILPAAGDPLGLRPRLEEAGFRVACGTETKLPDGGVAGTLGPLPALVVIAKAERTADLTTDWLLPWARQFRVPLVFVVDGIEADLAERLAARGAVDFVRRSAVAEELVPRVRLRLAVLAGEGTLTTAYQRSQQATVELAHDLRNPLSVIRMSLHLLRESEANLDRRARGELLEAMEEASQAIKSRLDQHIAEGEAGPRP